MRKVLPDPTRGEVFHQPFFDTAIRACQAFRTAIDGGAHLGIWTEALDAYFDSVIPVEPTGCGGPHQIRAALGDRQGYCGLASGNDNTGQTHVVRGNTVPIMTIDEMELDDCDFIKLDVEGYELLALDGGEQTIMQCRPVIVVELNGLAARYGYTDDDVVAWLTRRDYVETAKHRRDHLFCASEQLTG